MQNKKNDTILRIQAPKSPTSIKLNICKLQSYYSDLSLSLSLSLSLTVDNKNNI